VCDRDGSSVSSLSLTEVLTKPPAARDEYGFVEPSLRDRVKAWNGEHREEIIEDRRAGPRGGGETINRLAQEAVLVGLARRVTDRGRELQQRFARTMERYGPEVDWVADRLGDRGVMDLKRLATALWVTRELGASASVQERAGRLGTSSVANWRRPVSQAARHDLGCRRRGPSDRRDVGQLRRDICYVQLGRCPSLG
jgi:hypothetical protein